MRRTTLILVLLFAALPLTARAQTGNAEAGRAKNSMCIGCHGIPMYHTAFPEVYSVPKIAGQSPEYIIKALQEYRAGDRSHPTMRAIARRLTDQDMADLAAYYGAMVKEAAK